MSTHYRQAPEHKFPAAHDDTFAACQWVLAHARTLNGDPARVAVAGESAGGNMATNVSIRARDENLQPPKHQLLVYPVADSSFNTPSYQANAAAKPLSKPAMECFAKHTFADPAHARDPRITLLSARLTGLPESRACRLTTDGLRGTSF